MIQFHIYRLCNCDVQTKKEDDAMRTIGLVWENMNQWEYNTIPLLLVPPELCKLVNIIIDAAKESSWWSSNMIPYNVGIIVFTDVEVEYNP